MAQRIAWSLTATAELGQILTYLRHEVSYQTALNFNDLMQQKINLLQTQRIEGRPVPNRKHVRFILLGKHHRLYYRRHGLTLYIARLYDTRQNPDTLPYRKKG
jgi:plasmid stabilization system protein ParE